MSTITLRLFHQPDDASVPNWLENLITWWNSKELKTTEGYSFKNDRVASIYVKRDPSAINAWKAESTVNNITPKAPVIYVGWTYVAHVMDSVLFVISLSLSVLSAIVVLATLVLY